MIKNIILSILFLIKASLLLAQTPVNDDCANAISLCATQTLSGNNTNATAEPLLAVSSCFTPSNGVWYSFKAVKNGNATIVIDNINAANANNEIQAAIISFATGCDLANAVVLNCITSSSNINLTASALTINQTYYVYVDGGDLLAPPAGEFSFNIKDSGTAVKPTAQIIKTNASCNQPNGKILVKNVKLSNYPYTYSLNGGVAQSDSSFLDLPGGSYSIVITDASGCSFTTTTTISNNSINTIQTNIVNANCATSQKGSIAIVVTPSNSNYTYSLDGGNFQSGSSFANVIAGTHFITISGIGCDTTFQAIMSLTGAINSAIGQTNTVHCGTTGGTISYPNGVQPTAPPGTQYVFELLNSGLPANLTGNFSNLVPGIYQVKIYNFNLPTCFYTDFVIINELPGPQIQKTIVTNESCGNGQGDIKIIATLGVLPYTYSVDGGAFSSTNTFSNLFKGSYNVVVKDANGCTASRIVKVNETTPGTFFTCDAGETQTILAGDKASVDVTAPTGATISWQPPIASATLVENNYKLFPTKTTDFTMTATLPNGCVCKKNVQIIVKMPIDLPNTFTPNDDGKNDKFLIKNIENYRNVEVIIFDRWGMKVYDNHNYTDDTAWDGKSNGARMPVATYYYIIKFTLPEYTNDDNSYYYEGNLVLLK